MYVWYDTVLYLVPSAGLFAPYFYTDLISLYVHASPSWHVCPIAGNLFNPGTHAESSYIGDTGLLLTTYMNRDSWDNMRKMNFPFYYFDLKWLVSYPQSEPGDATVDTLVFENIWISHF